MSTILLAIFLTTAHGEQHISQSLLNRLAQEQARKVAHACTADGIVCSVQNTCCGYCSIPIGRKTGLCTSSQK